MKTFTKETLHIDDVVVYLKNERTGSSTIRKCKFIGQIVGFTDKKVKIRQLSKEDQFVTPEECQDYGEVSVYHDDIVHVIISKCHKITNGLIRILENDDWTIDYDKDSKRYRASYFEDNHFVDECWFDAYQEKEVI